eukprot:TRINITY_DN5006_c0_g1_i1.p1 TRINITY_DN5006_c0_g1~~TRINITY_DN5006_c0_g1_i1.p1  ORF type:complete len:366 (+),score=-77.02 TRINITY_DN5006_c0_g1_i1:906-2003(+)
MGPPPPGVLSFCSSPQTLVPGGLADESGGRGVCVPPRLPCPPLIGLADRPTHPPLPHCSVSVAHGLAPRARLPRPLNPPPPTLGAPVKGGGPDDPPSSYPSPLPPPELHPGKQGLPSRGPSPSTPPSAISYTSDQRHRPSSSSSSSAAQMRPLPCASAEGGCGAAGGGGRWFAPFPPEPSLGASDCSRPPQYGLRPVPAPLLLPRKLPSICLAATTPYTPHPTYSLHGAHRLLLPRLWKPSGTTPPRHTPVPRCSQVLSLSLSWHSFARRTPPLPPPAACAPRPVLCWGGGPVGGTLLAPPLRPPISSLSRSSAIVAVARPILKQVALGVRLQGAPPGVPGGAWACLGGFRAKAAGKTKGETPTQ